MHHELHSVRSKFLEGGRGGGWGGGSSEGCLKWGVRVIKGSFQKHLKTGWVKAKVVCRGRGLKV